MNLQISGHHLDVTPAIRDYVTSKLERITRHFDQVIDSHVILAIDNQTEKEKRQRAEINMQLSGKMLHVESVAQDLYAAIDMLMDRLDRQVVKYKSIVQNHNHESPKRMPEAGAGEAPAL